MLECLVSLRRWWIDFIQETSVALADFLVCGIDGCPDIESIVELIDVFAQARPLDRFGNTARLQYAMTRSLAAFVQYVYYYYLTDPLTAAQLGIAPEYDRNGVRVGLTTVVPLMR